jgi:hypothetical protein
MRRVVRGALLALSLAEGATAHRLDEYLQATLIGVMRDGVEVEIRLTPGVAVLPVVMAAIDGNRDGRISVEEERAYAGRVAREVELRVDGKPAVLTLIGSKFPSLEEMRQGLGAIQLKLRAEQAGRELRFENRHLPKVSAYLVNCLEGDGLAVGRQERDEAQRSIRFEYSFGQRGGPVGAWWARGPFWLAALGTLLAARMAVCSYPWKSR